MTAAPSRLRALLSRSRASGSSDPAESVRRALIRRKRVIDRVVSFAPHFRSLLVLAGVLYTLALPYKGLGRGHYISENALQPAQVNTYWNWADVHVADLYANDVTKWSAEGVELEQRSRSIQDAFQTLGLSTAQQKYSFELGSNASVSGINTYAILPAPKTDGAESIVLSASWLSRAMDDEGNRRVNTRGVAIVLALANYFKKYSMWSKDIIFLISDGYSEGAQAWLDSYHAFGQSNLRTDPLTLTTGPIWAALNLDYPHHSFSHIGLFYEGANGHLPNLDFINTASRILNHVGIPTLLHSHEPSNLPAFLRYLPFVNYPEVRTYLHAARNLFCQLALGADGRVNGPEATFGKYRIDAITMFGLPAEGPHGFHSLGQAIESTFRSLNNLLERFHQSFFLYIMTSVDTFIAVGNYLAAPILIGAGLTIQGLSTWAQAGNGQRGKPVAKALTVVGAAVAVGAVELAGVTKMDPTVSPFFYLSPALFAGHLLNSLVLSVLLPSRSDAVSLSRTLKTCYLLLSGLLISVTATLNFGLSVFLSFYLALALLFSTRHPRRSSAKRRLQQLALAAWSPVGLWGLWRVLQMQQAERWLQDLLLDWHVGGGWSLPVAFVLVGPLAMVLATSVLL
ncbi:hypothetical protein JCM1841_003932 [Sporobolomyces salmonicolor]